MMLKTEFVCQCEESPGKEPLGEHVLGSIADKDVVRNVLDYFLQFLKICRTAVNNTFSVSENEIPETEFFFYIVGKLKKECPRVLL